MFEKSTVRIVVFLFFKLTKREVTYALVISLLKKFVQLFGQNIICQNYLNL